MTIVFPKFKNDVSYAISVRYLGHFLKKISSEIYNARDLRSDRYRTQIEGSISLRKDKALVATINEIQNAFTEAGDGVKAISDTIIAMGSEDELDQSVFNDTVKFYQDRYTVLIGNLARSFKSNITECVKIIESYQGESTNSKETRILSDFQSYLQSDETVVPQTLIVWLSVHFQELIESSMVVRDSKLYNLLDVNSLNEWGNVLRQEGWTNKSVYESNLPLIDKSIERHYFVSEDGTHRIPNNEDSYDLCVEESLEDMFLDLEHHMHDVLGKLLVHNEGLDLLKKASHNVVERTVSYNTNKVKKYISEQISE